jgi:hypothetical protein
MSDPIIKYPMPTVDVKIKVNGVGIGNTEVYFDGVDVTQLLMAEPFEVRFATDGNEEPMLVVGLPIGELELDMTGAALNLIGIDYKTGEVA